jgi:hypothetical protein
LNSEPGALAEGQLHLIAHPPSKSIRMGFFEIIFFTASGYNSWSSWARFEAKRTTAALRIRK